MDDLTDRHSIAVSIANETHLDALRTLRSATDEKARGAIAAFGAKMIELARQANEAREALMGDLTALQDQVAKGAEDAFAGNIAAISMSAADVMRELEARAAFLRTGELPVDDPLPKALAPEVGAQPPTDGATHGEALAA